MYLVWFKSCNISLTITFVLHAQIFDYVTYVSIMQGTLFFVYVFVVCPSYCCMTYATLMRG